MYYKLLKIAKLRYWQLYFESNSGNSNKLWKGTKTLLGYENEHIDGPSRLSVGNGYVTDRKSICCSLNEYFSTVGRKMSDEISRDNEPIISCNFSPEIKSQRNYYFKVVKRLEILNVIDNLPNKHSYGVDEISNVVLKQIKNEIAPILTRLINISLISGYIPQEWKVAKVVPLFKGGDKTNMNNYRPISILPSLSKILEKIVYRQLFTPFAENHLSKVQFGFRPNHSTMHAILNFFQNIANNSSSKYSVGIFVDIKKAFDTVNHDILLMKLKTYGYSENILKWLRNYLIKRRQRVQIDNVMSDYLELSCGVPQGSILGPLLFLIYINDLPSFLQMKITMFADDTTIQHFGNNLSEMKQEINQTLKSLTSWLKSNRLLLNIQKTKVVLFSPRNINHDFELTLNGIAIQQVGFKHADKSLKFLGLNIDDRFNWKEHVRLVSNTIRKIMYTLFMSKQAIPFKLRHVLYNSLIKSRLEYGIEIYGESPSVKSLVTLQKRVIRWMVGAKSRTHTSHIFKNWKILKILDLVKISRLKFMFNCFRNTVPDVVNNFGYKLYRNGIMLFDLPLARLTWYQRLPCYALPNSWNIYVTETTTKAELLPNTIRGWTLHLTEAITNSYLTKCTKPNCFSCQRT